MRPAAGATEGLETVLVVEENEAVRELFREWLKSLRYRLFLAADPNEAEEIFANHGDEIDLLLTDIGLPTMDGVNLYRKLSESKTSLKVLFMSGGFDRTIPKDSVFLSKPFTREQLAKKVRKAMLH